MDKTNCDEAGREILTTLVVARKAKKALSSAAKNIRDKNLLDESTRKSVCDLSELFAELYVACLEKNIHPESPAHERN